MPAETPALSVILTTCDRPEALACVLEGYRAQTFRDFEIVVGDDGSDARTARVLEDWTKKLEQPLVHVWQERRGHGRARAINAAVRASRGRYLVFSDGDCVPEADFLAVHAARRQRGAFLNGRRLLLGEEWGDLTPEQIAAGEHRSADVEKSWSDLQRLRRKSLYYRAANAATGGLFWSRLRLMGANCSLWREDFEAVNGFDECYIGWGTADEDLRRRLRDLGLRWREVMAEALVWHLPHPPTPTKPQRIKDGRNIARYDSGLYLTRPLRGLRHRGPAELTLSLAGEVGRGAEVSASAGRRFLPADAEVVLLGLERPAQPCGQETPGQVRAAFVAPGTSPQDAAREWARWRGVPMVFSPWDAEEAERIFPGRAARYPLEAGALAFPRSGESAEEYFARHREVFARLIAEALPTADAALQGAGKEALSPPWRNVFGGLARALSPLGRGRA